MLFISHLVRSNRIVLCEKRRSLFVTLRQVVHIYTATTVRGRVNSVKVKFCMFT